jgi:hypothetical protein
VILQFPIRTRDPFTFTEHEHEVIKTLGDTMVAKNAIQYWHYGETDEGDEWYVFIDHFGSERLVFNKAEDGACRCMRNMNPSPLEMDIEKYISDMWGNGWESVAREVDNEHTATILEFHPLAKQA